MATERRLILVTGATGYVGGRLLRALEQRGERIRCAARRPEYLRYRIGAGTEVVPGDVFDGHSMRAALEGVHTAYYLVHSMGARGDFEEGDRLAAGIFARAAADAGVRRIIYLGGLGEGHGLSKHLRSRQEVGRILRESGVPTIEFRASIVIGSGSLSFEMVRALVEKLPVMITPRWVRVPTQPIAIEDLIAYLVAALDLERSESEVFEIGGADVVSYADLMREYGTQRGLRRLLIRVPLLTPRLSSLWLGLVTPIYARVGRELIDGLRNPTVVRDARALDRFPIRPRSVTEAIHRALSNEDSMLAQTRWSGALSSAGGMPTWAGVRFGSRFLDSRWVHLSVEPRLAFAPIRRIGGDVGWYYGRWLWRIRGVMDLLVGGPGLRRGRRDPDHIVPGEPLDFWRVEAFEPDRLLRLQAEMRLPGRAWLQFEVQPVDDGVEVHQTAIFDPVGLGGLAYWYAMYPAHQFVFAGMLRGIARAALAEAGRTERIRIRSAH